ncbi:phosphate regulon sensor histidine kinase PhoR [Roseateles depolymerans]|uniref:Phosphate regulon sensor protein PhoR n=1 Tax=Roseateles depolymerans TaxID=76731 RepID=A0A0U3MQQ4_9BURK|nr:phosphate regulon sensor histidine kinase PhoR [Roseateles depolymerans]ALV06618.1 Phosphate regulon sensor protein PhoR [Roseateles depolymerans]REG19594.1 multi-sensor signal transduction histidine kinase [Roseateles depolymerans]
MSWLLSRVLMLVLGTGIGGWIGWWLGHWMLAPPLAAGLGAGVAVSLMGLWDAARAHRLVNWLRGDQTEDAPRLGGIWGEIAYRMERGLRDRERRYERERQQLEQFLQAMEASPNGVILLDDQDQIQWCNTLAAHHFQLDPQRDKLQRITNLVRYPAFVSYLQSRQYNQPLALQNSRGKAHLQVLMRDYGVGGECRRLILSLDVTDRERNESMRRDFVANVSHEIRTPLTVLSGFIETMASLNLTEAERKRVLQLMQQQTQRMQTLVGDLLTLAQLEGSPRPAPDHWIALDPLLARIAADARALSAGRHELVCDRLTQVEVAGVETELLSAIANLVSNAVRYTPEGGRIELHWRWMGEKGGEISVVDNGPGIAREHLPRLTERFYRVDGSRSRDTGGTGLGLSIVKHVIQRHGGELRIDSEPGHGSAFRLLFPATRLRLVDAPAMGEESAPAMLASREDDEAA